jgi:putative sigma-54 modulation protein
MNIIAVTFRHMNATEAVKGYATDKVARMQRFLRAPMKCQVTLSCQQDRLHKVEVEIHSGPAHFHAHETSPDMYASIDKVSDKIERQIVSAKEVVTRKKGGERASQHLLPDVGKD